ncbi:MAG: mechanosensitive ion channel family protein [Candidatus Sericytochromatia bacterium]
MPTQAISDWGAATWTGLTAGLAAIYGYLPNILGAILILLVGWAIASLLYTLTDKLLDAVHFDRWMAKAGVEDAIERSGVRIDASNLLATIVKWTVLLIAFMMAAEQLGFTHVSVGIAAILGYIPNVIAALVILALGVMLANFVSQLVRGAAGHAGLRTSELLSNLAYWAIVVFATLGAIGQLNIAPALVQTLYTAVIAAIALAGALAFGLGLRDQAKDVIAGRAVADHLRPGDEITVGDTSGRVASIGATTTLLETASGKVSLPNHLLTDQVFRIAPGGHAAAMGGGGGGTTPITEETDTSITGQGTKEDPWRVEPGEEPPV